MASLPMQLLAPYLRLTRKPLSATAERTEARLARRKRAALPPRSLLRKFRVEQRSVAGFSCYSVLPRAEGSSVPGTAVQAVLYLHGGSYISPISAWHWRFIARLAAAGHRVEVPLYGLAPESSHRDASGLLAAVYRNLLEDFDSQDVAFMGDSAGGGLALAFAQQLAEYPLPQPRRLVLLSPWVDVAMENPELAAVEAVDPWLSRAGLRVAARAWASGDPLADPRVSPVNGTMSGLPPTDVFVGTHDLPYPDVLRLESRMRSAGIPVSLHIADGGVHVYPLLPVPEGRAARKKILELLRS
ncbi:alpha/beta hydrolase fold domain-containing protein [Arthrobacter sp. zg-Y1171]|uniref:alpha/beta hydrolase fold domain-containing protein n=1 Tax=Arthrobacter sp. zg-Y1171 TaxID=2964610 RepID=UPI002105EBD1|nr:alpha/beta hydrolase [Arthrobacter sp. zg-Y1171]MCQ1995919.1 alpha/beta hydrolase [Arthrobacter sp. zg-Y1171]UWX83002.1 alpha/beta hydrolase [Arthrobacter sp. zg-Y1171]